MFASNTLLEHLVRGAIGLTALALAFHLQDVSVFVPILLVPIGLLALKGCPMCWTLGLGETLLAKLQGKPTEGLCRDGSCAVRRTKKPSLDRMFQNLFLGE
jgi:hypothetical protein